MAPLPPWLDLARLLGAADVEHVPLATGQVSASVLLETKLAADVAARLRGLGFDGERVTVSIEPSLDRAAVREGRLREARARRETTPGFVRREALASGEGRYSLTPEVLALALGRLAGARSVVDAGCGVGGNALGFARAGSSVTAIERDAERLANARHNARVYGVAQRIAFRHGDAREWVPRLTADILFIDPPWGGPDFDKMRVPLTALPLLTELLPLAGAYAELWLKLPPSFVTRDLGPCQLEAFFGEASGDGARVKFLLARMSGRQAAQRASVAASHQQGGEGDQRGNRDEGEP